MTATIHKLSELGWNALLPILSERLNKTEYTLACLLHLAAVEDLDDCEVRQLVELLVELDVI